MGGLRAPLRLTARSFRVNSFRKNSGDDETRTRDLCRDSVDWFANDLQQLGTAKIRVSRIRQQVLWVKLWVYRMVAAYAGLAERKENRGCGGLQPPEFASFALLFLDEAGCGLAAC